MDIYYLEIVTTDADAVCKTYTDAAGARFGEPDAGLGNAKTCALAGGGMIGVRAPMHDAEEPTVRTYWLVDDIDAAVTAALADDGKLIHSPTEIPGHGKFAIYLQGGVQHGFWQR